MDALDLGNEPIDLADVQFRVVTPPDLDMWFSDDGKGPRPKDADLHVGDTIAVVETKGPTGKVAVDKAKARIDVALDAIRVSVADFRIRIHDNQLRFQRSPYLLLFDVEDGCKGRLVWSRPRDSVPPGLSNKDLDGWVRSKLSKLEPIWIEKAGRPVLSDIERAVMWIGRSIRATDFDDKIIALYTAQECILSGKNSGLKTNDLAIRAMVLGEISCEGFTHPGTVIGLYQLRSDVVHGSRIGLATDKTYRQVLTDTIEILYQVLQVLGSNPKITKKSQLHDFIDSRDCLPGCLAWCEQEDPNDSIKLQEELRARIEKSQPAGKSGN